MPNALHLAMTGDTDITFTRRFDATPALVWRAMTEPALITKWLWAREAPMTTCDQDFRVGGQFRWVWHLKSGQDMAVTGQFLEIAAPNRLIHTELFDEDWTGGETTVTYDLAEVAPQTTEMRLVVRYPSAEIRQTVAATPMADGMEEGYSRLDSLLPSFLRATQKSDFRIMAEGQEKITVTRSFNAPIAAVWQAHMDADLIRRWMGSPEFPLLDAQIDPRTGGGFRLEWKNPDGSPLVVSGTYLEVSPTRTVHTEVFEPDWTGGETHVTTDFIADGPRTKLRLEITYSGTQARDSVFASGMGEGMAASYEALDAIAAA